MRKRRKFAAFILAGGRSSRMGRDKGLLPVGGEPLVVRTAREVSPLVSRISIVGGSKRYAELGFKIISDFGAGRKQRGGELFGPVRGIAAALQQTRSPRNLILACDLPFVSRKWIEWLLARASQSGSDAVVPRTRRGLEPLAAVYRRECAPVFLDSLARGERTLRRVISSLRIEVVHEREWREVDPDGLVLKNMNTPRDYRMALRRIESRRRA